MITVSNLCTVCCLNPKDCVLFSAWTCGLSWELDLLGPGLEYASCGGLRDTLFLACFFAYLRMKSAKSRVIWSEIGVPWD